MRAGRASGSSACATGDEAISKPTATNDSQNPGCVSAQGSSTVTATAASNSTIGQGQRRPKERLSVTTASIRTVRCAGRPPPENTA
jgi:hypothetical protein